MFGITTRAKRKSSIANKLSKFPKDPYIIAPKQINLIILPKVGLNKASACFSQ